MLVLRDTPFEKYLKNKMVRCDGLQIGNAEFFFFSPIFVLTGDVGLVAPSCHCGKFRRCTGKDPG